MPYTIAITNDTPQALAYVEKAKKLAQPTIFTVKSNAGVISGKHIT